MLPHQTRMPPVRMPSIADLLQTPQKKSLLLCLFDQHGEKGNYNAISCVADCISWRTTFQSISLVYTPELRCHGPLPLCEGVWLTWSSKTFTPSIRRHFPAELPCDWWGFGGFNSLNSKPVGGLIPPQSPPSHLHGNVNQANRLSTARKPLFSKIQWLEEFRVVKCN